MFSLPISTQLLIVFTDIQIQNCRKFSNILVTGHEQIQIRQYACFTRYPGQDHLFIVLA